MKKGVNMKKFILKLVVKDIIKKMPKYKEQLSTLIKENADNVLSKVEGAIIITLKNMVKK